MGARVGLIGSIGRLRPDLSGNGLIFTIPWVVLRDLDRSHTASCIKKYFAGCPAHSSPSGWTAVAEEEQIQEPSVGVMLIPEEANILSVGWELQYMGKWDNCSLSLNIFLAVGDAVFQYLRRSVKAARYAAFMVDRDLHGGIDSSCSR